MCVADAAAVKEIAMTEPVGREGEPPRLTLDDLPAGLLDDVAGRLRAEEPAAVGILATGSYAAGRADSRSDVDLTVLTAVAPRVHYRTWFEPRHGPPLHVSVGAKALADWVEDGARAADWALGFPTEEASVWIWTTDAARAVLGDPPVARRPPALPELEDFLECATKVRRAARDGDNIGARWHAHRLGCFAPGLLRPLNPERRVTTVRDALQAALEIPEAPDAYRADLALCLGLEEASDRDVIIAALHLATGILALLRERRPGLDRQPDLPRYLADGTLERHLEAEGDA